MLYTCADSSTTTNELIFENHVMQNKILFENIMGDDNSMFTSNSGIGNNNNNFNYHDRKNQMFLVTVSTTRSCGGNGGYNKSNAPSNNGDCKNDDNSSLLRLATTNGLGYIVQKDRTII